MQTYIPFYIVVHDLCNTSICIDSNKHYIIENKYKGNIQMTSALLQFKSFVFIVCWCTANILSTFLQLVIGVNTDPLIWCFSQRLNQ